MIYETKRPFAPGILVPLRQRMVTIRRHDRAEDRRVTGDHPSRPSSSTPEPSCTASPRPRSPAA